jgi:hypothetical protein
MNVNDDSVLKYANFSLFMLFEKALSYLWKLGEMLFPFLSLNANFSPGKILHMLCEHSFLKDNQKF